jgi:hypothetical protein
MHPLRQDISEGRVPNEGSPLMKKGKEGAPLEGSLERVTIRRQQRRQVHQRNEDRFFISNSRASARWRHYDCSVKIVNVSSNGLMIETDRLADIGERVMLQLSGCNPVTCFVRWIRDGRIGLEFADETEILSETGVQDYLVETISEALGGPSSLSGRRVGRERRSRAARHGLVWVGSITIGSHSCPARLRNISSTGAMVAVNVPLAKVTGERVMLDLGAAGSANGVVCWATEYELGIEFALPFDVTKLPQQQAARSEDLQDREPEADTGGEPDIGYYRRERGEFDPHQPPEMAYGRLTLEEVYATLYPNGRTETPSETEEPGDVVPAPARHLGHFRR